MNCSLLDLELSQRYRDRQIWHPTPYGAALSRQSSQLVMLGFFRVGRCEGEGAWQRALLWILFSYPINKGLV